MKRPSVVLSASVLALLVFAACGKKAPPAAAPTPAPAPAAPPAPDNSAADAARRDSIAKADAARAAAAGAVAEAKRVLAEPIRFEFDSDVLSDEARASLDKKITVLTAYAPVHLRAEGNTDERGSDEYNLALGQRRAAAAKRYMAQHGIDEARIEVISYGEERPANAGHDESSWSQNRRDDFQITAGGDAIVPPRQQ